jgi:hypothetical protein
MLGVGEIVCILYRAMLYLNRMSMMRSTAHVAPMPCQSTRGRSIDILSLVTANQPGLYYTRS